MVVTTWLEKHLLCEVVGWGTGALNITMIQLQNTAQPAWSYLPDIRNQTGDSAQITQVPWLS